ncbi:hypothetical protein [Sutcliffiella horikoshii]|uniref:Uncharacterized protein n=1 Tax=Sutcliffiella horikoshii TaxID=79883 RepID=A0A5D4TFF8_9BACI|nr:hypothetical protein [Sutcliffiella horikoshii]TYS74503.1 hypothetical protein FZC75_02055 [Sutcliffiella horikoshii]
MPTTNLATVQAEKNTAMEFVTECVGLNRHLVVEAINNLSNQFTPDFIIETYTDQIIAAMLADKSSKELLQEIASGKIFVARETIIQEFKSDFLINRQLK